MIYKHGNECPVCSGAMRSIIDLPDLPMTELYEPWNAYFERGRARVNQEFLYCDGCSHGKLGTIVPPEQLYKQGYRTTTSKSFGASAAVRNFAEFITLNCQLSAYECAIDIGANDGSLLDRLPQKRRIAVDPNASGDHELIRAFIEDADLSAFKSRRKLVCCSHTLEHIEKQNEFFAKLSTLVSHGDLCAFQFPSLDYLVRDCRIDQIHHQHIHYYSLRSISLMLAKHGFEITHHEFDASHYGTLMVMFQRGIETLKGEQIPTFRVTQANALFRKEMWELNARLDWHKELYGYGASLMLPVLYYYLPSLARLQYVMDEDASKHGQRYVNFNVKIVPVEDVTGRDVMVTAFNTKRAVRAIVSKLFSAGAENVIVPFHVL